MMKERIFSWIPVYATERFYIEKPANWDDMDVGDKSSYFLAKMILCGPLCGQCNCNVQLDGDIVESFFNENVCEFEEE